MRLLFYVSLVMVVYEACSMILPLRVSWPVKLILFLPLLDGAFKNQIFQRLGGGMFFAPDLPRWLVLGGSLLYNLLVVSLVLLLCKDVLWLMWKLCPPHRLFPRVAVHISREFPAAAASACVLILSLVLTLWGTWEAVRVPDVKYRDAEIAGLAPEFEETKVAVLVDLHASALNRRPLFEAIVDRTMAEKPDLILMPGDFVDGRVQSRAHDLEPLSRLRAPLGVFASSGNHEYYSGYQSWVEQLKRFGITWLENEHRVLARGLGQLVVAGLPDQQGGRFGHAAPDPRKALEGAPAGVPVILLAHRPEAAKENARAGVALQVSGHTHGGMMPGLNLLVARFNKGYVKGWYDVDGMKLFNSPGTSLWNGFPLRIFDPAEITILVLHARPKAKSNDKEIK
ncbi:MAG: metallophosphoesterase [Pyramidobacter sp.]|nr:metallophosphoesterase [Pyramidobacter sp.]